MPASPTLIPGLRGPYEQTGGIFVFPRMLDKIRLHAEGSLPDAWAVALGVDHGFDGRLCRFLNVSFADIQEATLKGGSDEEVLNWAFAYGRKPSSEDIEVWNAFMMKMGWRDVGTERIAFRLNEAGLPPDAAKTMFDFIDLDEGRPPRWT